MAIVGGFEGIRRGKNRIISLTINSKNMEKEQIREARRNMSQRIVTAIDKTSTIGGLFTKEQIGGYMFTGSQALIVGGLMTHRDGDDVDIRICIPTDENEKARVWRKLQAWEALYEKESDREKYKETVANQMFTFRYEGIKVNVFAVSIEEYSKIPIMFCAGYFYEKPASVLYDKMRLKRGKDYEDLHKMFAQFV